MTIAPIVMFVYNRPQLARQTLECLAVNELASESDLFIFSDGAKQNATQADCIKIEETRKVIREKAWCKTVTIIESSVNKGLATSVIEGVTEVVSKYGNVIVIEDDVLLSPHFLKFMNDALKIYKDDSRVGSIGSWNYFCPPNKLTETFFFRYPDTKGWATFERAWKYFEPDSVKLIEQLKSKSKWDEFNFHDDIFYMGKMLQLQAENKISSWAIRWTASSILNNMLTLFPATTLSKDIGFGADATHDKSIYDYNANLQFSTSSVNVIIQEVIENNAAIIEWKKFSRKYYYINQGDNSIKGILRKKLPFTLVRWIDKNISNR